MPSGPIKPVKKKKVPLTPAQQKKIDAENELWARQLEARVDGAIKRKEEAKFQEIDWDTCTYPDFKKSAKLALKQYNKKHEEKKEKGQDSRQIDLGCVRDIIHTFFHLAPKDDKKRYNKTNGNLLGAIVATLQKVTKYNE